MLNERSKQIRKDTITLSKANGGYHFGGCFSCVEILIALYDQVLADNDKFILSKGHSCWPYYVLLREKGYNPRLEGHPHRDENNGIYCTTGSLGHGFPTAIGMALAKKMKGNTGNVYVLMGDGECQEGTTWESLLIAGDPKYNLDNLTVIVDWNYIQGSGFSGKVMPALSSKGLGQIFSTVGWEVCEVDGHDMEVLCDIMRTVSLGPRLIIAKTVKGKGVSFMENKPEWHAKWLDDGFEKQAFEELS